MEQSIVAQECVCVCLMVRFLVTDLRSLRLPPGPKSGYGDSREGTAYDRATDEQTQFGVGGKENSYELEGSDPQLGGTDTSSYAAVDPQRLDSDRSPIRATETVPGGDGWGPEDTCKAPCVFSLAHGRCLCRHAYFDFEQRDLTDFLIGVVESEVSICFSLEWVFESPHDMMCGSQRAYTVPRRTDS